MTDGLTDAEQELITHLRQASRRKPPSGFRYANVLGLLLDVGRLFTPQPWPGGPPPGRPGNCYIDSVLWAAESADGLAYVEGVVWWRFYPTEHAWCAGSSGVVLDPTWSDPGAAYLGLPVHPAAAVDMMRRLGGKHALLTYGPVTLDWPQHGVPDEILIDIGRPVPRTGTAGWAAPLRRSARPACPSPDVYRQPTKPAR